MTTITSVIVGACLALIIVIAVVAYVINKCNTDDRYITPMCKTCPDFGKRCTGKTFIHCKYFDERKYYNDRRSS